MPRNETDAKEVMSAIKEIEERRKKRKNVKKILIKHNEKKKEQPPRLIKNGNSRYKFELEPLGKEGYECVLDSGKAAFSINTDHPQYAFSRREGSLPHHFRRVIIFEIARTISGDSLTEFVNQYQSMMLQDITMEGNHQ